MNNKPLLSICIPTYKRDYVMRELLESIYSQGVSHDLFEVCITENSDTDETQRLIEQEFAGIDNLHYKRTTCQGFLNSFEALKSGNGELLKLHNDYSILKPGMLEDLIKGVQQVSNERPLIFFSVGALSERNVWNFDNYNDFMDCIGMYATWSTSFSIWREDLDRFIASGIEVDHMYPHTTILHSLTYKTKYYVANLDCVDNKPLNRKGGYNLVDNFVRIYLGMVRADLLEKGAITGKTYRKIENQVLHFVAAWLDATIHDERFTFEFDSKNHIIRDTCGLRGVLRFNWEYAIISAKRVIKGIIGR